MSKSQIEDCIKLSLESYFKDLDGEPPNDLYAMMLEIFERPLIAFVLDKACSNQSKASEWLGLNRNTLRKKMKDLGLNCESSKASS